MEWLYFKIPFIGLQNHHHPVNLRLFKKFYCTSESASPDLIPVQIALNLKTFYFELVHFIIYFQNNSENFLLFYCFILNSVILLFYHLYSLAILLSNSAS